MRPIPAGRKAGQPFSDACMISLSLKPGERAVEARQRSPIRIKHDGTCELEMEVGKPPEDKIEPIHPPSPPPRAANREPPSFLHQLRDSVLAWLHLGSSAHAQTVSAGYTVAFVTDPVGIWTSSEQINLNWFWGGINCATLVQIWRTVPFVFAGWYNEYNILDYPQNACDINNNYTGGYLWSDWYNYVFPGCGINFGTVDATYQPVAIFGDGMGTLTGNLAWQVTGPSVCIGLLTFNFQVVRTWN